MLSQLTTEEMDTTSSFSGPMPGKTCNDSEHRDIVPEVNPFIPKQKRVENYEEGEATGPGGPPITAEEDHEHEEDDTEKEDVLSSKIVEEQIKLTGGGHEQTESPLEIDFKILDHADAATERRPSLRLGVLPPAKREIGARAGEGARSVTASHRRMGAVVCDAATGSCRLPRRRLRLILRDPRRRRLRDSLPCDRTQGAVSCDAGFWCCAICDWGCDLRRRLLVLRSATPATVSAFCDTGDWHCDLTATDLRLRSRSELTGLRLRSQGLSPETSSTKRLLSVFIIQLCLKK